ncbi:hypothetical protein HX017_03205 [Myroides marinus]|uniref:hypothetical protein n=1 Tax=Myroides marinus TaxID=703342 RepID=UPI002574E450|nr:hypothetical protein [Myroides marinus]MDM1346079.1 hypothetical protein [Myroides marinus]MDM1350869.1 hypothetical protein [Myroides marinus]MDM1353333.1 hypothetical protein [Myroides marinus]MDM1358076.1 hypothetical protein [Myroides marinus]MDM1363959.1 hypothetical protein [Myroides marinus]
METNNVDLVIVNEALERFKLFETELSQAKNKKARVDVERNIDLELSLLNRKVKLKKYDPYLELYSNLRHLIYDLERIIEIIKEKI